MDMENLKKDKKTNSLTIDELKTLLNGKQGNFIVQIDNFDDFIQEISKGGTNER